MLEIQPYNPMESRSILPFDGRKAKKRIDSIPLNHIYGSIATSRSADINQIMNNLRRRYKHVIHSPLEKEYLDQKIRSLEGVLVQDTNGIKRYQIDNEFEIYLGMRNS